MVYPEYSSASKKKPGKDKMAQTQKLLETRLLETAEVQESPFKAKGAKVDGELDQYYTVLPAEKWAGMKKYNNFISKFD